LEKVTMPGEDKLPASIQPLAFRNAATMHAAGGQFRGHMDRLIRGIKWLLDHAEQELQAQPPAAPQPRGPDAAKRGPGPAQPAKAEPAQTPEAQCLLAEIADPTTGPKRRLAIGDRLAELGNPRPGAGQGLRWGEVNSSRSKSASVRYGVTHGLSAGFLAEFGDTPRRISVKLFEGIFRIPSDNLIRNQSDSLRNPN
jgi:hypothetical protein